MVMVAPRAVCIAGDARVRLRCCIQVGAASAAVTRFRRPARYRAGMPVSRSRTARAARRRKRRMAQVEHDLTTEQWVALQAAWGGCAYCGRTDGPLQRDCVLPISRGGRY